MKPYSLLPILCLLCLPLALQGQQEPLIGQYRLNAFVINPAFAGWQGHHEIRLNSRSQWRSFPGSPRTNTLSYQGQMDEKSGFGAILFRDAVGPSVRSGLQISYAFKAPMGEPGRLGQNYLSLGVSGKLIQYGFRAERVHFVEGGDPAALQAADGASFGDVAFGALWHNERWFVGFSAPNLIQSDFGTYLLDSPTGNAISQLYRHYFLIAGYELQYDRTRIEPTVLLKKTQGSPYQIEGLVKWYLFQDRLMLGLGYRTDWLVTSLFGIQGEGWLFAYSADFMPPRSRIQGRVFGPSHEFTLGIDIGKEWALMYRGDAIDLDVQH